METRVPPALYSADLKECVDLADLAPNEIQAAFCTALRRAGATVVDVGMNRVADAEEFARLFAGNAKREEAFRSKGSVLVGDVHPEVAEVAGAITPVPGGVGPLTIAMLMSNTVKAAKIRRGMRVAELSRA